MSKVFATNFKDVRRKIARAAQSISIIPGKVVTFDVNAQTADILIGDEASGASTLVSDVPLLGGYIPERGHQVGIQLIGNAPVVLPPSDAVFSTQRGRFDSTGGDNMNPNPGFESLIEPLVQWGDMEINPLDHWVAGASTTIAQSSAQKVSGSYSLLVTSTASSNTPTVAQAPAATAGRMGHLCPVVPGRRYFAGAWARAVSTGRMISFHIFWHTAAGAYLSTSDSGSAGNDGSGGWTLHGYETTAPAGAAWASVVIWIGFINVANGEQHYLDDIGFNECVPGWDASTAAKTWTFDSGTDGWGDPFFASCTVAQDTDLDPPPMAGLGSLKVTVSGTGGWAVFSPTGVSGVPTIPGARVVTSVWVRAHAANAASRTLDFHIDWENSSGAYLSSSPSAQVAPSSDQWYSLSIETTAPANAAYSYLVLSAGSPSTAGEIFYVDSAFATIPTNTSIGITFEGTYVRSGGFAMRVTCNATGIANVQTPPGDSPEDVIANAIQVTPGDYWDVDFWYTNHSGNSVKKSMLAVATWFSESGNFLTPSIGTFPITAPGSGWIAGHETFIAPANAAYMRISLAYLGSTNDIIFVDDVLIHRNSIMKAKVIPEGNLPNVAMRSNLQPIVIVGLFVTQNVWISSPNYVYPDPHTPVQFEVNFHGWAEITSSNLSVVIDMRIGISFDNGTTWNYGQQITQLLYNPGTPLSAVWAPVVAAHQLTGMPTSAIKYRFELRSNTTGFPSIRNASFLLKVLPAAPAGSI